MSVMAGDQSKSPCGTLNCCDAGSVDPAVAAQSWHHLLTASTLHITIKIRLNTICSLLVEMCHSEHTSSCLPVV